MTYNLLLFNKKYEDSYFLLLYVLTFKTMNHNNQKN